MDSFNDIGALSSMLQESREAAEGAGTEQDSELMTSCILIFKLTSQSNLLAVNTQPPQQLGGTRVITGCAVSSSDAKKASSSAIKDNKTIWRVDELPTEVRWFAHTQTCLLLTLALVSSTLRTLL